MLKASALVFALALVALAGLTAPARADFSACGSALAATDPQQKVDLYTICLKHGGLVSTDVSSAFNNRGVAYEQLGQVDKALEDFGRAIKYDAAWPTAYSNRARIEARQRHCKEALADIDMALKLVSHRPEFLTGKARILGSCPDPQTHDPAQALALAQEAVKLKDDWSTRETLAFAFFVSGERGDAERELQTAIDKAGREKAPEPAMERMRAQLAQLQRTQAAPAAPSLSGP